jgi:hypothetical protein
LWAVSMLKSYEQLNDEEKKIFGFIKKYQSFINELKAVFES